MSVDSLDALRIELTMLMKAEMHEFEHRGRKRTVFDRGANTGRMEMLAHIRALLPPQQPKDRT